MAFSQTIVAPTGQTKRTTKAQPYIVCRVHRDSGTLTILKGTAYESIAIRECRKAHSPQTHEEPFVWHSREQCAELLGRKGG